jgi:regulator of replication initiation timing
MKLGAILVSELAIIAAIIAAAVTIDAHAQTPPDATEAIAKQIGWLVIQNANLQVQVDDLKKKLAEPQCSDHPAPAERPPPERHGSPKGGPQ